MILDNQTLLSGAVSAAGLLSGQAVTVTAVSNNTYDTASLALGGNQPNNLGRGEQLHIFIGVLVAALAVGAATVDFEYIQADDALLTVNVEVLGRTGSIPKALLVVGAPISLSVDRGAPLVARRYIGLRYVVGVGPLTAGTFTAAIVEDAQMITNIYGRSGFSVT